MHTAHGGRQLNTKFEQYLERGRWQYGSKFDVRDLHEQFIPYFNSGERIRVRTTFVGGEVWERTGTVGVTTGWKPAFLLMHRITDIGSSDLLSRNAQVVAVKRGRKYVEVEHA